MTVVASRRDGGAGGEERRALMSAMGGLPARRREALVLTVLPGRARGGDRQADGDPAGYRPVHHLPRARGARPAAAATP